MTTLRGTTMAAAAAIAAMICAGPASARCVSRPSLMRRARGGAMGSRAGLAAALAGTGAHRADAPVAPAVEPSIVGYWYTQYLADGQLIDDGFDAWMSDGMEILNDSPMPASGAVCLGVWQKTAPYTYVLKHPTWIFDDTNTNLIGVAILRTQVTLDASGNSFKGQVTIDAYDLMGNSLGEETADLAGERIVAVDDPAATTPIPGLPASILNR